VLQLLRASFMQASKSACSSSGVHGVGGARCGDVSLDSQAWVLLDGRHLLLLRLARGQVGHERRTARPDRREAHLLAVLVAVLALVLLRFDLRRLSACLSKF
jgi:hypothetical protein